PSAASPTSCRTGAASRPPSPSPPSSFVSPSTNSSRRATRSASSRSTRPWRSRSPCPSSASRSTGCPRSADPGRDDLAFYPDRIEWRGRRRKTIPHYEDVERVVRDRVGLRIESRSLESPIYLSSSGESAAVLEEVLP